jgi:hypothetical protein
LDVIWHVLGAADAPCTAPDVVADAVIHALRATSFPQLILFATTSQPGTLAPLCIAA